MQIRFEKANHTHLNTIFDWLSKPFVQEFWDNTPAHKVDIRNFVNGRKTPSSYANGKYVYWIAQSNNEPFAMIMSIEETLQDHPEYVPLEYLSQNGHTYSLDYMIGNEKFFGKGYGTQTLTDFIDFFIRENDPKAKVFVIAPSADNPRAKHVYMKSGFDYIKDFVMPGEVSGFGKLHHLLIKRV